MNSRSIAILLVASPVLVALATFASEAATYPVGQGGQAAMTTIGGRFFGPWERLARDGSNDVLPWVP